MRCKMKSPAWKLSWAQQEPQAGSSRVPQTPCTPWGLPTGTHRTQISSLAGRLLLGKFITLVAEKNKIKIPLCL